MSRLQILCLIASAAVVASLVPALARACPFCSAQSMTFAEEMANSDAAIIARLVAKPAPPATDATAPGTLPAAPAKSTFEIVKVLKGDKLLGEKKKIEVLFFGQQDAGTDFLLFGVDPKELAWGTPTPLSERGVEYLSALPKLPEAAVDRLAFFQKYFEDPDPLLSSDAYNEFSKVPYADVAALKDKMNREHLLTWIKDPNVPTSRRRLYLTMLGMCGKPEDVPLLEQMIKNEDRQTRTALDAMIGCYVNLKGAEGLPLVEDLFLKNSKADYVDTWSTIQALRIMGQETTVVPKDKLVAALRHMLDRPQLADLVIPDLARWQDWSAMDRLVQLFKEADEETSFVRVPVVQYLRQCPDPKAQQYLKELAQIDPDAVKRAMNFFPIAAPSAPAAKTDVAGGKSAGSTGPAATDSGSGAKPAGEAGSTDASKLNAPPASGLQKAVPSSTTPTSTAAPAARETTSVPSPSSDQPSLDAPRAGSTSADAASIAQSGPSDLLAQNSRTSSDNVRSDGEKTLTVAQDTRVDGSRDTASPAPPINPPERGRTILISALAVGGVLLLLLLVIVRGRREPAGS